MVAALGRDRLDLAALQVVEAYEQDHLGLELLVQASLALKKAWQHPGDRVGLAALQVVEAYEQDILGLELLVQASLTLKKAWQHPGESELADSKRSLDSFHRSTTRLQLAWELPSASASSICPCPTECDGTLRSTAYGMSSSP